MAGGLALAGDARSGGGRLQHQAAPRGRQRGQLRRQQRRQRGRRLAHRAVHQGAVGRIELREAMAELPLRRRHVAHAGDQRPGAGGVGVAQAVEQLDRRVPGRAVLRHRAPAHQLQRLRQPPGAVAVQEVVAEVAAHHLVQVHHEPGALGLVERQLVVPDVARLGARVDEVVGVEVLVGVARQVAAGEALDHVDRHHLVLGDQGAEADAHVEQGVHAVGRVGVQAQQRVAEVGRRVAQVAAHQQQADGAQAVELGPAFQRGAARIARGVAGQQALAGQPEVAGRKAAARVRRAVGRPGGRPGGQRRLQLGQGLAGGAGGQEELGRQHLAARLARRHVQQGPPARVGGQLSGVGRCGCARGVRGRGGRRADGAQQHDQRQCSPQAAPGAQDTAHREPA